MRKIFNWDNQVLQLGYTVLGEPHANTRSSLAFYMVVMGCEMTQCFDCLLLFLQGLQNDTGFCEELEAVRGYWPRNAYILKFLGWLCISGEEWLSGSHFAFHLHINWHFWWKLRSGLDMVWILWFCGFEALSLCRNQSRFPHQYQWGFYRRSGRSLTYYLQNNKNIFVPN